jgi:RNA 2',3'-cyclic 3'-phosphodiesterase
MNSSSLTTPIRCFVAISLPLPANAASVVEDLTTLTRTEELQLRIVPPENFHITLKFLGNVDADQVGFLDSILRDQCAKHSAFTLRARGIGYFKDSMHLNIVSDKNLDRLVSDLNKAFAFLGYERERKKYLPHITLARFKPVNGSKLSALISQDYLHQEWGELAVDSIQLIKSETSPEGASYMALGNYSLNG